MVQCQLSKLKLTKIITVLPFFLVINQSTRPLRYMEENKATDLWFDLAVGQVRKTCRSLRRNQGRQKIPLHMVLEKKSLFSKYLVLCDGICSNIHQLVRIEINVQKDTESTNMIYGYSVFKMACMLTEKNNIKQLIKDYFLILSFVNSVCNKIY